MAAPLLSSKPLLSSVPSFGHHHHHHHHHHAIHYSIIHYWNGGAIHVRLKARARGRGGGRENVTSRTSVLSFFFFFSFLFLVATHLSECMHREGTEWQFATQICILLLIHCHYDSMRSAADFGLHHLHQHPFPERTNRWFFNSLCKCVLNSGRPPRCASSAANQQAVFSLETEKQEMKIRQIWGKQIFPKFPEISEN